MGPRGPLAVVIVLLGAACTNTTGTPETSDSPDDPAGVTTTVVSTVTSLADDGEGVGLDKGLFVLTENIEPIRTVRPDEVGPLRGACLQHRGIDVTIGADGSSLYFQGIPQEQQDRLQEEQAICIALYPLDDTYGGPLDDEELGRLYDYYVESLVPCLEAEGYSGFDAPSRDTYIESYGTESDWIAYTDILYLVDAMTVAERVGLFETCPQAPPVDELFAD